MEVIDSKLNLPRPKNILRGIKRVYNIKYAPSGFYANKNTNIIFDINSNSTDYIDLAKCKLRVSFKIKNNDGSLLNDAVPLNGTPDKRDFVASVNLALHSLFRQVDLTINQQLVNSGTGSNHGYKAYIDALLDTEQQIAETSMKCEMFEVDNPKSMHSEWLNNPGFVDRYQYTSGSRNCVVEGPLRMDLSRQNKLIPPNVRLGLKLYPAEDGFRLITSSDKKTYKVEINNVSLDICYVELEEEISGILTETLKKEPALYFLNNTEFKTFNIDNGLYRFTTDNICQAATPTRIIVGMVDSEAYNGSFKLNPYNFENFNVSQIELMRNGLALPSEPLKMDFKSGDFLDGYKTLFYGNNKCLITPEGFKSGYCLYVFNLQPHVQEDVFCKNPILGGLRLNILFNTALTKKITLLVYGIYNQCLQLHCNGSINYI